MFFFRRFKCSTPLPSSSPLTSIDGVGTSIRRRRPEGKACRVLQRRYPECGAMPPANCHHRRCRRRRRCIRPQRVATGDNVSSRVDSRCRGDAQGHLHRERTREGG